MSPGSFRHSDTVMERSSCAFIRLLIYFLSFIFLNLNVSVNGELYANQWAVYMKGGMEMANRVAFEHGFRNMGPVGMLKDVYFFTHLAVPKRHRRSTLLRNMVLEKDARVSLVVQQKIKKRVKRDASSLDFNDRRWKDQWYLHRSEPGMIGHDMNILPAWKKGITGKNVVVTILDDGIEYTHRELKKNYDKNASYDYNDIDPDPQPKWALENSQHGTRCAAQVAAEANNSYCIVGVAYNAKIGGIRMLDGRVTDLVESQSLMHKRDYIDIYSASWGPEDDGFTVDGPGNLTKTALKEGVLFGRKGKGSIFVWASGNGGHVYDDCNCDGYTNSIYTISAAAATSYGSKPWYLEECASTLISSYGSGESRTDKKIVTADLNGGCTYRHTGTSVAAPFVAGFIALALEVNSKLTWRDVQHLLVRTANINNLDQSNVRMNGAKKKFSPTFGFGMLDGGALVDLAAKWSLVSEQHVCQTPVSKKSHLIDSNQPLIIDIDTTGCKGTKNFIRYLEHVHIVITLAHSSRGEVSIYLVSAMKTRSRVLHRRKKDYKKGIFKHWEFLSTHFWGENPIGRWKLEIHSQSGTGFLEEWQLVLYGSEFAPGVPYPDITKTGLVPGQEGTKCHQECLDGCTGPEAYQCNSCRNYRLVDGNRTCVESCPGNYLTDEISLLCLPCQDSCWSCFGPNSNECSSCRSDKVLYQNECVDECPPGYFKSPHVFGFQCLRCDGNCLRCSGTAENCTRCRPEDMLMNNHCFARCDHESFFDGINCIKCHQSCHTCIGSTADNCTSCRYKGLHGNMQLSTTYLYKGSCLPKCPVSYYGDQFKGFCEPCGKNCLRCESEGEKCLVCKHGYFRLPNNPKECVRECLKGQYPDLLLGVCMPCSHNCLSCLPGHPHECTSCGYLINGQPLFLKQSSCVYDVNCGLGFFANKTSGRCDVCPFPCTTCNADENCQACFNHYVNVDHERCMERCPSGTYRDMDRKCVNCHPSCKECYGPGTRHCRKCHRGMVLLDDNTCSWYCPVKGYHRDVQAQLCKPCHPSCLQCYGPSVNQCIRCIKNLDLRGTTCVQPCVDNYLTENSCEPCNKQCKTCYGPKHTECLSCYHNKTLHDYQCRRNCPKGYYKDNKQLCQLCHRECSTCYGPESNNCLSCSIGFSFLDGTCVRKCPKGYFQQDDRCLKCSDDCAECQYSSDICMHCKPGKVWRDFGCHDSCGEGRFVVPETRRCHKCHPTCKSCFGFDGDQCSSCAAGALLYNSICFEECPARFVAVAPTNLCNECPENCLKCSKESNFTTCELCRHPYINFDGKCVKSCPGIKYYHNYYTKTCEKCHESCEICYGPSQGDCIMCKKNFVLVGHKCIISNCSKDTFLDSQTFKCQRCNPKCKSCTGPGSNECTECLGEYVLHQNSCILGCNDGSYPDESVGNCRLCDPSCKSCNGPTGDNCTACKRDHALIDGKCILGCKEGEYPDEVSRDCKRCHFSCKSCNGPELNNCTACRRQHALLDNACVLSCTEGMFPNAKQAICEKCSGVCKTCDGPTINNCTTCEKDFTLVSGTCVLDCPEGSYPDADKKQCKHCHELCKSCNGPTKANCTSCKKEFTLIGSKCVLDCTEGKFPDDATQQCKHCSVDCKTCHGPTESNCTSCHKEYTLADGKCVLDCPSGKYPDANLGKCRNCDILCKSCNGSSARNCTSCKKRYTLIDGSCVLFCNEGNYPDEKLRSCLPCHSRCRSCSGPNKDDCSGCREGYMLEFGKCVPDCTSGSFYDKTSDSCIKCNKPCSGCYGPKVTDCTSCRSDYNLVENTCFPTCKSGEFLDDKHWRCVKCDNSCEDCFGPYRSNCTQCKLGYMLFDNTCFMVCTDGTFPNYKTGQCEECPKRCRTCTGPLMSDCDSCMEGYRMTEKGCDLDCQPGTYPDESLAKCQNCNEMCLTCSGPTQQNCTSCYRNSTLTDSKCVLNCSNGFFPATGSGFPRCLQCHEICDTCSGPGIDNCLSCKPGFVYKDNTCIKDCPESSFYNSTTMECHACNKACLRCNGPSINNCTSCLPGFLLKDNKCEPKCQNGSFYDNKTNSCLPCARRCLLCDSSDSGKCTKCRDAYIKIGNSCELDCQEGTFADLAIERCFPCHETCRECSGSNKNDCTSCTDGYELKNSTCVKECAAGTYADETASVCKECDLSCGECGGFGSGNCTSCKGTAELVNGTCILKCSVNEFIERDSFTCVKCYETCRSCSGPTEKNCTACEDDFTLIENRCIRKCSKGFYLDKDTVSCNKCSEVCKTCNGPSVHNCTFCKDGFLMENNSCLHNCTQGYFGMNGTCIQCSDLCSECLGSADNCTACKEGFFKHEGTCIEHCFDGRYLDADAKECLKCHESCNACNGPSRNNCTSCPPAKYFDPLSKMCLAKCKLDQYAKDSECFSCHSSCQSCSGPQASDCMFCSGNLMLYNSTCIERCPDQFYKETVGDYSFCRPCPVNCRSCSGENNVQCLSCVQGLYLQEGKCVASCSEPYIADNDSFTCEIPVIKKPFFRQLKEYEEPSKSAEISFKISYRSPTELVLAVLILMAIFLLVYKTRCGMQYRYRTPAKDPTDYTNAENVPWTERKVLKKIHGAI